VIIVVKRLIQGYFIRTWYQFRIENAKKLEKLVIIFTTFIKKACTVEPNDDTDKHNSTTYLQVTIVSELVKKFIDDLPNLLCSTLCDFSGL